MIISNLSVPLLGMVDTAVVGHLDEPHHMGAVAVGSMIFGVVFWGFGFLRMGTTGLAAQALGATRWDEVRALLVRALILAGIFALGLIVMQVLIADIAFYLMSPSEIVESFARQYFHIRIASAPATLGNYVLVGWFLGMQNARAPLYMLLAVNGLNMVLDVVLVSGFGFGADGVAWASFSAEYFGFALGLVLVRRELRKNPGAWRMELIADTRAVRKLLNVNQHIFIRTLCLMFTLAFFTAQGSRLGDVFLAANALLFNFQAFMAYGLDGFAHAAEALVGKHVGARDRQGVQRSIAVAVFWALLISFVFTLTYWLAGTQIIYLLTDIQEVRTTAQNYLFWVVILPLVSVWSFMFDGIYIGATRTKEMRNTMLIATLGVFLPAWYGLQRIEKLGGDGGFGGNHHLWLAFLLFMVARAVAMGWWYYRLERRGGFALMEIEKV
jgi:MATE family multidrug resistance protein